ncbi:putative metal binding protein [Halapricum desulfuricans]|uniref:UPF0179 protein HSBGL_2184 n=1 Tax=Halapricum desulfuricans TaxID=2841257 RepID=A0A897NJV0_9EURY|nr:UPF0179 family protein [Halapricum desulfuricans]QSG12591.1 putative metal binding protein [Halapricum desulfuricans]
MAQLTLVGTRLAEVGQTFVYQGPAEACEGCPYRDQCLNLTAGRKYEIVTVRENASVLDCGVHDTGVQAVEVEPASIRANVASKGAYAGSKSQLEGPCPYTDCPSHEYCEPAGAAFDEQYTIDEVFGEPPHDYCMLDRDLTLVEFAPPDDA